MLAERIDQLQRRREALTPGRLVPDIVQVPLVLEPPARRGVAGCEETAEAALGDELDPAVIRRREIGERGHAREQQLAIRDLRPGSTAGLVWPEGERALEEP